MAKPCDAAGRSAYSGAGFFYMPCVTGLLHLKEGSYVND